MNKEIDEVGKIFRESLKNHRIETDANLWVKLDSQLSLPSNIVTTKVSLIKSLPLLKIAAAVSLIVSVALAYNYIYLPLSNNIVDKGQNISAKEETPIDNKIIIVDTVESDNSNIQQENKSVKNATNLLQDKKLTENSDNNKYTPVALNSFSNYQNNNTNQNSPDKNIQNNILPITKVDTALTPLQTASQNDNPIVTQNQAVQLPNVQKEENDIIDLQIPNYFTPNNDGFNDNFVIKNIEKCNSNQLIILSRTGATVYDKINYQNNWDGTNLQNGVYFYVFKYKSKNKDFEKMGTVTIDR